MAKSKRACEKLQITQNRPATKGSGLMLLSFFSPEIALSAKPGQFIEIGFDGPTLPKPFSIHDAYEYGIVEILYQVVGPGTQKLAGLDDGDEIVVFGPLGKGFDLPEEGPVYLVGGGTGNAPIKFLQKKLAKLSPKTFLGAKTKTLLPPQEMFDENTYLATDDGSAGFKGTVVDLMSGQLLPPGHVFACGPKPMLKGLWKFSKGFEMSCQFSLESYMACGVGACLRWVIQTTSGYKKVCSDGPVFNASEVADAL